MTGVEIPVKGNFGQVEAGVRNLTSLLKELGFTAKEIRRAGLGDLGVGEAEAMLAKINANFADVKKHMQGATGQKLKELNPADFNEFVAQLRNPKIFPSRRMPRRYVQDVLGGVTVGTPAEDLVRGGGAEEEGAGARRGGLLGGATRMSGFGMLKRFTGIGLGLAGIGGLAVSIGSAVSGAQQEAIGLDSLLRELKDTSEGFGVFRKELERSTRGLALTYQESIGLAQYFARMSGQSDQAGIIGGARQAEGFARSYGIAPQTGVGVYGQASLYGIGQYTPAQLSRIFADAITASGMQSRSADVMQQMVGFMGQSERFMVNAPNLQSYANLYASMNQTRLPGLHGPNAAQAIATMDQAFRAGGGAGIASQNMIWQALNLHGPGLSPFAVQKLQAAGLFGTRYAALGMSGPGAYRTNFQNLLEMFDRRFGKTDTDRKDVAFGNTLQISPLVAHAIFGMKHVRAESSLGLLQKIHVKVGDVDPSGFKEIAEIAGTRKWHDLAQIRSQFLADRTLGKQDQQALTKVPFGHVEALKEALARVAAQHGMHGTEGYQTLSTMTAIKNALTDAGSPLLSPINQIRDILANEFPNAVGKGADWLIYGGELAHYNMTHPPIGLTPHDIPGLTRFINEHEAEYRQTHHLLPGDKIPQSELHSFFQEFRRLHHIAPPRKPAPATHRPAPTRAPPATASLTINVRHLDRAGGLMYAQDVTAEVPLAVPYA